MLHAAAFSGRIDLLSRLLPLAREKGLRADAQVRALNTTPPPILHSVRGLTMSSGCVTQAKDGRTPMDLAKQGRNQPDPAVYAAIHELGPELGARKISVQRLKKEAGRRRCALCMRLPLAAMHAALAVAVLLGRSVSIYEIVWQLHHVDLSPFLRNSRGLCGMKPFGWKPAVPFFCAVLVWYAGGLPWIISVAGTSAPELSQLSALPVICVLLGSQIAAVSLAMHFDPGAVGCRRTPAAADSWRSKRELVAVAIELLQHISVSFAAEVSWNTDRSVLPIMVDFALLFLFLFLCTDACVAGLWQRGRADKPADVTDRPELAGQATVARPDHFYGRGLTGSVLAVPRGVPCAYAADNVRCGAAGEAAVRDPRGF